MSKTTKNNIIRNIRFGNIATIDWGYIGVEIFQINQYQLRFIQGKRKIDYYPTSGKYFDMKNRKWGSCTVSQIKDLFFQGTNKTLIKNRQ